MLTWIIAVTAGCVFIAALPWMRPRARPSPGSRRLEGVRLARNEKTFRDAVSAPTEGSPLCISIFLPLNRVVLGMESRLESSRQKLRSMWSDESKYFSRIWFRSNMERRRDFLLLLLNELIVALEPYFCSNRDCRAFVSEAVRAELLLGHEASGGVFFEQHIRDIVGGNLQPHFAAPVAADPTDNEAVGRFVAVLEGLCASMYAEQVLLRYHRAEAKQRVWLGKWTRSSMLQAALIGFVAIAIAASIFYLKSIYYG